jgi:long-subunit acyl-CoA synthetase (AMP-forming)
LTEGTCCVTLLPGKDAKKKAGSTGRLLPNLEAKLVPVSSGENGQEEDVEFPYQLTRATRADEECESGVETGELWVRGPTVMKVISSISPRSYLRHTD